MKKIMILLFSLFLILPVAGASASSSDDINQFKQDLEKSLVKGESYYAKNSIEIVDSVQLNGNVTKVLKPDDPATPEDESKIDKYQSNIIVALVQTKEKRDKIFSFSKKELYYYDVTKKEFLVYSNIYDNPQIEKFFNKHIKESGKHLDVSSLIILLLILSTMFILTYYILVFNAEPRAGKKIWVNDKYSSSF